MAEGIKFNVEADFSAMKQALQATFREIQAEIQLNTVVPGGETPTATTAVTAGGGIVSTAPHIEAGGSGAGVLGSQEAANAQDIVQESKSGGKKSDTKGQNKVGEVAEGVMMGRLLRDTYGAAAGGLTGLADALHNRKTSAETEYQAAQLATDAIGAAVATATGSAQHGMAARAIAMGAVQATGLPDRAERAQNLSGELKKYGRMLLEQGITPTDKRMREYASKIHQYVVRQQKTDRLAVEITNEYEPSLIGQIFGEGGGQEKLAKQNFNRIQDIKGSIKREMNGYDIQGPSLEARE